LTDRRAVVAVDLGGTTIKAGIVGPSGVTATRRVASRADRGPDAVMATIVEVVGDVHDEAEQQGLTVVGAAIAVPGIIDERNGIGRYSVTFDWRDLPIGAPVAERLWCPVIVRHDVRAGALAELSFGAATGASSALFVPIGTGLAAAIVIEGRLVAGSSFQAGELGQIVLEGAPGVGFAGDSPVTLEATSSARAIGERYARATDQPPRTVTAQDVAVRVAEGDEAAVAVWTSAVAALGRVLASVVDILDPAVIVIGGGLSRAGDALLGPLNESIAALLPWREAPSTATARFADYAGFVGAAIYAWEEAAGLDPAALAGALTDSAWPRRWARTSRD